jgi:hypothetical protein
MNNEIQNYADEKERLKINLYIEVSLATFFLSVIAFSAIVLLG